MLTHSPIPFEIITQVMGHAEKEYPRECCGLILGKTGNHEDYSSVILCANAQDKYHHLDPAHFPRTAKAAYFIEPAELIKIQKMAREEGRQIRVIYHSHVDAKAYFSEEDKHMALLERDEPTYPGVQYLVVSIVAGKVKAMSLFFWDPDKKEFVE